MTSILKVNQIQNTAGAVPTAADLGLNVTGSVLQFQTYEITDNGTRTFTSSSLVDAGETVTITPSAVGNKLHVAVNYSMMETSGSGGARLALNGTSIGGAYQVGYNNSTTNRYAPWACQHTHTTTNTNAHVFKVQFQVFSGSLIVHANGSSVITVMEIAG